MADAMNRRTFFKGTVAASAGAALTAQCATRASSADATSSSTAAAPTASPADALPCGKIGDLQVSRLLLGGNLLTHFTHSRDLRYVYNLAKHYNTDEKILETMAVAEANGINTLTIHNPPNAISLLKRYRRERAGKIQWIICSTAPVEPGLAKYTQDIQRLIDDGADAIYLWGVRADALVAEGKLDLVAEAVEAAKACGVPSGVGSHELAVVMACEKHGVDANFYIKTLHHHDYPSAKLDFDSMWCKNPVETVEFMRSVKKPWIGFKVMAAGAIPPQNAFQYALESGVDFVLAGMFDYEIAEDVRIIKQVLANLPTRQRPWQA
ncbi:MAG: hypothetical protein JJ992_02520 [Planctomycetes bacterium]|nr:hypothetical protein [Planctomycetota bacterium]